MALVNLDMDLLRTIVTASDYGGFVHAASRLGRSQSAISLQMKKLEEQVGQALFRKNGRGTALTEAGDLVLNYARRILDLNDEAISAARGTAVEGSVKLGVPQDFAERWLPGVLARFNRAHPNIHVQLQVGSNRDLLAEINQGTLELALAFGEAELVHFQAELPVAWIAARDFVLDTEAPLPLALLDPPCMFRQTGIEALEQAKLPWRLTLSTPALSGLWAALEAGLGVSIRTRLGLPDSLTVLRQDGRLPALPMANLVLCAGSRRLSPAASRLLSILVETLEEAVPEGAASAQLPDLVARAALGQTAAVAPSRLLASA